MFLSPTAIKKSLKAAGYIVLVGSISWVLYGTHSFVYKSGVNKVTLDWTKEKLAYQSQIAKLTLEKAEKESEHAKESKELSDKLAQEKADSTERIARLHADYTTRLHKSEDRANLYQRMSKAGASEQERLAIHAAGLDRSLEEGRLLVAELRETVEHRDRVIEVLGQQILTDRKLFEK